MFLPSHFTEPDTEIAVAAARAVGFGHLIAASDDGIVATPVPFLLDDEGTELRAHLARPNPLLATLPAEALVIVPVSDAYISPGWYPSKAEHGKVVPTWNYEVVHLHGRLEMRDTTWTEQLVRDLTDHHEATMPTPWSVDDAPEGYITKMLSAIVGVSLSIDRIVMKRKLSQNRPAPDVEGAITGLRSTGRPGDAQVADAMQ